MKIQLHQFMSHDNTTVELPARGVVLVVGANGSGKSALVEGISMALWGKSLRGRSWSPWRPEMPGHVELVDGSLTVTRSWTGKTKKLDWAVNGTPTFDTNTKSQEALDTLIGSHEVWRRTCVFSSADAAHFTLATDAERKGLLEQLLGLGWFDRALDACRVDLKVARGSKGATDRDLDVANARKQTLSSSVVDLEGLLESSPMPPDAGLRRAELAKAEGHVREVSKEIGALDSKRTDLLGAGGADKERAQAARARLTRLSDDECPTCGQEIHEKLRRSLQQEVEDAVAAAETAREAAQTEIKFIGAQLDELRGELSALSNLTSSIRAGLSADSNARQVRSRIEASLADQRKELAVIDSRIAALQQKTDTLAVDIAELEACEQILGVRGARAHVLGQTLSSIEARTNAWLSRLSSDIVISLRSYTEKKSGGTVDSISLTIEGAGGGSGYTGASAGERRRVDVALLLALAELASGTSNGAQWRSPIVFDEVFDSLDADGREAVNDLVLELAQDRCVILITHDEHVASCPADLRIHIDEGSVT